jgi:hypothetical protein
MTELHPRIIKRMQVQPAGTVTERPSPIPPPPARCKVAKSATLVEAAGRPVAIEITCSCGETTLVEIEFPVQPATTQPTIAQTTTDERKVP